MGEAGNMLDKAKNSEDLISGIINIGQEQYPANMQTQIFFTATAELQAEIESELNGENETKKTT